MHLDLLEKLDTDRGVLFPEEANPLSLCPTTGWQEWRDGVSRHNTSLSSQAVTASKSRTSIVFSQALYTRFIKDLKPTTIRAHSQPAVKQKGKTCQ